MQPASTCFDSKDLRFRLSCPLLILGWSLWSLAWSQGVSQQTPRSEGDSSGVVKEYRVNLGTHDYLMKPFAFSELLARLDSIRRRGPSKQPEILRIADLEVDLPRQRVMRSGRRIELTPKEFSLLTQLAYHVGEVQSRTLLAAQLWGIHVDSDTKVVAVHISRLRAKVDAPFEKKLVHTIRGLGYLLEERS